MLNLVSSYIVPPAQDPDPAVFDRFLEQWLLRRLPAKDRRVFAKGHVRAWTAAVLREAFRQGGEGYVHDALLLTRPWGFRLEDVGRGVASGGKVRFWYGGEDRHAPPAMGRFMADRVPRSVYREYGGETHNTLADAHEEAILRELLEIE